jgi:translation initiation factor IF-2
MTDSTGSPVKGAIPGMAVTVSGWKELPGAGDEVLEGSEQDVKKAVANRQRKAEEHVMMVDIDAINIQRRLNREQREREEADQQQQQKQQQVEIASETEKPHELLLIIKGDVSGSVEALVSSVESIGNESARVRIVHTGVGEITDSDILLAKTSKSEFPFSLDLKAKKLRCSSRRLQISRHDYCLRGPSPAKRHRCCCRARHPHILV